MLKDFSDRESDLVYRLKIKDQDIIFYVLMEFQSSVDFQMPYRLLTYMVEIWKSILKDIPKNEAEKKGFKLPAVIPIVLYNGAYNWTACRSFKETLSGYELFEDSLLDFKYILIDVNRYNEEELIELSNLIGTVFLLDQKADTGRVIERLKKVINTIKNLSPEEFLLFKNWFGNVIVRGLDREREEVSRIIEESEEVEAMVYNLERALKEELQKTRAEGVNEGIKEGKIGIARNMLKKGMPISVVAEITELTTDEVEKIKSQIINMSQ